MTVTPDPTEPPEPRPGAAAQPPMEVHAHHLRDAADAYDVERGELATLVGQAAAELAAIGDFWGGGKAGSAFARGEGGGAGYEAVSAQVVEGLGALLEAHGSISTRLRLMARRVEVADWDTVAALLALPEPPP
ncbi:hypothetical protein [Nonomuraea lactucae]|uniref:hypothetical protein n=1 Tax=Nonomuraea lactucae TaxID=2249762 RepID=UPI000DE41400|nr:hypothetical protein [Nonomuraea lactucae]